ncbi:hypothetical protein FRACYDRAFT_248134 [Fragilariopsis cylindrus CCMP1102]|uniref:Uncharacterized protein n=1 Tax=Fragilariopsis cylindrus CCMP1102 TaxID=635003 RepID=A0A1E7EVN8_9STRA|nr:hypothetical protein FRACYDRAFT_248134 [Fragilariopsis cylindrus CCMP1102]|eukprot:OEU09884.1 hypothetical protein FRACYDRAFT_248134 [Fragilariopsis cylindrus CCMP1102]
MSDDEEESILSLSTLLFAVVTLAVYILFLRPTPTARNNNNNGTTATTATTPTTTATAARTTAVHQRRANALAGANNANATARRQQQQQQQQNNNTTVATIQRRPPVLSENAIEVLKNCKAYPPHVEPRSIKSNSNNSIGCYNLLSDSGLVSFNYLKAASAASAASAANNSNNNTKDAPIDLTKKNATTTNANNNNSNNKIQRQERAKILSRLFANSSTVATPPMKGSTFIIGVSYEQQLLQKEKEQKLAIIRVIKGLATYYNVLVIVAVDTNDNDDNSNNSNHHRYESTQKIHEQVVQTLRSGDEEGVGGGEKNDDSLLSESILPSHRILLSKSAVGRIALVRQLSSNIGLTIDFNPEVKLQLEKFGYNVSIIKNWSDTFPSPPSV